MTSPIDLFIYVRVADVDAACRHVLAAQASIAGRWPGVTVACYTALGRSQPTVMETYANVAREDESPLLDALSEQLASSLDGWATGPRHVERFARVS